MDSVRHILDQMQSIRLEAMGRYALMNRVDTKYVFSVSQLADVLKSVSSEYRVLSVNSLTVSPYETLYFDTHDHRHYLHHHNRRKNRRKYRMRRYVASDLSFLEVKSKDNKGRSKKDRTVIDRIEPTLSESAKQYFREITGTESELLAQLLVEFSRITLVSPKHLERTTLDVGLAFSHDDARHEWPGVAIAEVKQPELDRNSPLRTALKSHGIRPMRVSKYCLGCISLKPHLKYNRFKRKLNTIHKIAERQARHGII